MNCKSGLFILISLPAFHCILLETILIASQLGLSKIVGESYKNRFKLDDCTLSYEKPYVQFNTKKQLFDNGIYFNKTNGELLDKIFEEGKIIRKDENNCYQVVEDNSSDDILTFKSILDLHKANIFVFPLLEESLYYFFENGGSFQLSMIQKKEMEAYWDKQPLPTANKDSAKKYFLKKMIWDSIFPPGKSLVNNQFSD